jgi:hypothetical protein
MEFDCSKWQIRVMIYRLKNIYMNINVTSPLCTLLNDETPLALSSFDYPPVNPSYDNYIRLASVVIPLRAYILDFLPHSIQAYLVDITNGNIASVSTGVLMYVTENELPSSTNSRNMDTEDYSLILDSSKCDFLLDPKDMHAYYTCRRKMLLRGCGDVCNTSIVGEPAIPFNKVHKNINCKALWSNSYIDASLHESEWPPSHLPPSAMINDFTYNGKVKIIKGRYFPIRYGSDQAMINHWSVDLVRVCRECFTYPLTLYMLLHHPGRRILG